jgi:hypothetical protein
MATISLSTSPSVPKTSAVTLDNGKLVTDSWGTWFKRIFVPGFSADETKKVIEFIGTKLKSVVGSERKELVELSDAIIKRHRWSIPLKKTLLQFDRQLGADRPLLMGKNIKAFAKWKRYGFNETIFHKHFNFVNFMLQSTLGSQIKVTGDKIEEVDNEPAVMVDGKKTKFSDLEKRFTVEFKKEYREKFICEKATGDVYTYLGLGTGLVKHHPFKVDPFKPFTKVGGEDYRKILASSKTADGKDPENKHTWILQVVSTYMPGKSETNWITGNLHKHFTSQRHPYFQLITDKGEVSAPGYLGEPPKGLGLFETKHGQFRNPDRYIYQNYDHVVTSVAITAEEGANFQAFVRKYYKDGIENGRWPAFNFVRHNCTTFIREGYKAATGVELPTRSPAVDTILRAVPPILEKLGILLKSCWQAGMRVIFKITPRFVSSAIEKIIGLVGWIITRIIALGFSVTFLFAGGASGKQGPRFGPLDKKEETGPFLQNPLNWLDITQFDGDYPGLLQAWQRKLPNTFVHKNTTKLTIVPQTN